MNNLKQMFSVKTALDFSPATALKETSSTRQLGAQIRNVPDNVIVTFEIFKSNVCRICAKYHKHNLNFVPLYEIYKSEKVSLANIINPYLPIKVHQNDGLPQNACRSCTNQLMVWHKTWLSIAEANKALLAQSLQINLTRNEQSQLTKKVQNIFCHHLLNTGTTKLVCQKCDLKTSGEQLIEHLESKHEDIRSQDNVESLSDHIEEVFLSESDDNMSVTPVPAIEEPDIMQSLECPLCASKFSTTSLLLQHLSLHDVVLKDGPACCGVIRDSNELIRHLIEKHKTQEKDETNQKRIPAVCPDCNHTFSNKYNMMVHMKSHTAEKVKFDCECGKSYTTRGNLTTHIRIAHHKILPHRCPECDDRFPTRAARDTHVSLHTGARPYSCSVCPRTFRAKIYRDRHISDAHSPRKFECELCGKRFKRKTHLRYHVGTHRRSRN